MSAKIRAIVQDLDHPLSDRRLAAADELVSLGELAEPVLTGSLVRERRIKVKRRILLVLAEIKAPKMIPALMGYVHDTASESFDDTRALAMRAMLGSLKPKHRKHCFDFFVELRRDEDPSVRRLAMEGLHKLGDPRALRFLDEVGKNDKETEVRELARRLAATFVSKEVDTPQQTYGVKELEVKLASRDAYQRQMAIDELVKRPEAKEIFLEAVSSPHALARRSGLMGLGELADRGIYEMLLGLADGLSHMDERVLALRALAKIDDPPGDLGRHFSVLSKHAKQREDIFLASAALSAIAKLGTANARDVVVAALKDSQVWIRESAAQALAEGVSNVDKGAIDGIKEALARSRDFSRKEKEIKGTWPEDEIKIQLNLLRALNWIVEPGSMREIEAVQVVTFFVLHPREEVRREAWHFLTEVVNSPRDIKRDQLEVILDQVEAPEQADREAALAIVEVALRRDATWASRRLAGLTYREDRALQLRLIPMLAKVGDREAELALGRLAHSSWEEVASAAMEALEPVDGELLN